MSDLIDRQAAIDEIDEWIKAFRENGHKESAADACLIQDGIIQLPSVQPERLTDDDFETIRIHLNSYKEKLCNQQRWEEAEEYQRIIDRFMAFASTQPDKDLIHLQKEQAYMQGYEDGKKSRKGKWIRTRTMTHDGELYCDQCEQEHPEQKIIWNFCPNCGSYNGGDSDD